MTNVEALQVSQACAQSLHMVSEEFNADKYRLMHKAKCRLISALTNADKCRLIADNVQTNADKCRLMPISAD